MDRLSAEMQVTIVLEGEVDLMQAKRFDNMLDRALLARPDLVVLDVHGLRFIDGRSLGVISATASAIRSYGGIVRVIGTNPFHRRLFDLVGLRDLLDR